MAEAQKPRELTDEEKEDGMVLAKCPGHGILPGFLVSVSLPVKTVVPAIGHVQFMRGHFFPKMGLAYCKAEGSTGTWVHPAQGLISRV